MRKKTIVLPDNAKITFELTFEEEILELLDELKQDITKIKEKLLI